MSSLGTARYGVATAPGGLAVVQELLNTASAGNPRLPDLLAETRTAGQWLSEARSPASDAAQAEAGYVPTEAELRQLRELRAAVAASVAGLSLVPVRAGVRLELDPSGVVGVLESEQPVKQLMSAVLLQILLAQHSGQWQRLKICGNPDCDVAFFDRSKNRTGVWHDVRACGNAINLRASRSRRRAETRTAQGDAVDAATTQAAV